MDACTISRDYSPNPQNLRRTLIPMSLMAKFTVLGGPSSEQLARKIASRLKSRYVGCELRVFPDGESKITVKGKLQGKIIVVQSVYPPVDSNLIRAFALLARARENSSKVYAVIPYIGYQRQDRKFLPGEVVSMALVANLFKAVGVSKVIIVDVHSMRAINLFDIPAKNVSAVEELAKYFSKLKIKWPLVVSPDVGGYQRAKNFARHLGVDFIVLKKHRDRKTGKVSIRQANHDQVRGRDLIVVDDIISSGSSIVKAAQYLKSQQCGRIYATCTHAVLVGDAEKKIRQAGVTKIVSTNTIPGKTGIVDVSSVIAKAIS
jgi:ribose-phosphate pyrophosphokinase